jgi:hypothetical protein
MDIAIDNTILSRLEEDNVLHQAFARKMKLTQARLVVSLPVLHEAFATSNHAKAAARARILSSLASALGTRFLLTGEVQHVVRAERKSRGWSTPPLSAEVREQLLGVLRRPDFEAEIPTIVPELERRLQKAATLANDRRARKAAPLKFPKAESKDVDLLMEKLGSDTVFWNSPFLETVSRRGRYRQRMRELPRCYPAALTMAAYGLLNAMGAFFAEIGYGSFSHVLRAPRPGDWVDAQIAGCAAYCRVFLTGDAAQQNKVRFLAMKLPLRMRALSVQEWLSES